MTTWDDTFFVEADEAVLLEADGVLAVDGEANLDCLLAPGSGEDPGDLARTGQLLVAVHLQPALQQQGRVKVVAVADRLLLLPDPDPALLHQHHALLPPSRTPHFELSPVHQLPAQHAQVPIQVSLHALVAPPQRHKAASSAARYPQVTPPPPVPPHLHRPLHFSSLHLHPAQVRV